jgi:uncharacterized membrane protein required for colicin V production
MTITQNECLFVILLVAAFIGLWRGWLREVITTAILLGVILFLTLGGQGVLYQFIFVNLEDAVKALFSGSSSVSVAPATSQPAQGDFLFTFLTFGGLTTISYVVGHKAGRPPTAASHRLTGIIPGIVNGIAIAFYSVKYIIPQLSVSVQSPDQTTVSNDLPVVFGLALIGVIVVLIVLSTKGKAKK